MSDHLSLANEYITARLNKQNDKVDSLVTDDIVVESSRDGTHTGRSAFNQYLNKVSPTGTWEKAELDPKTNQVVINGKVKVMLMNWNVCTKFEFKDDKISRIVIAKK